MSSPELEHVAHRAGDPGSGDPGSGDPGAADLWLVRAGSVGELSGLVASTAWHTRVDDRGGFGLLLAWAGDPPDFAEVAALARTMIESGMFYFGAWGPGSGRIEYAVDVTDVTLQIDADSTSESPIVMTTAFDHVPLDEALFELWELAPRDDGKAPGPARVVVVLAPDAGGALASAVRLAGAGHNTA